MREGGWRGGRGPGMRREGHEKEARENAKSCLTLPQLPNVQSNGIHIASLELLVLPKDPLL